MVFVKRHFDDLPTLDAESAAHMQRVLAGLHELMEENDGVIGFDDYMSHVLYAPGLGYYSAGAVKLGAEGDYVTAPLISSLFGQTLAKFVGSHLAEGGEVLELGAGTGVMAADILQTLEADGCLPRNYLILEPSADLKQRQQETLNERVPHLMNNLSWLDRLEAESSFKGIVLGNEVLDAMPARRFVIRESGIQELGVALCEGLPCWQEMPADKAFQDQVGKYLGRPLDQYPEGYCSEFNPGLEAWVALLAGYLHQGILLLIDYGYDKKAFYQPERVQGTLRAYHRHHAIDDPFFRPGMTDITTWVNFTALAEVADHNGLSVAGYTSQANFLIDSGLAELFQAQTPQDTLGQLRQAEAVKCLTMPGEMGETVKVMALTRNSDIQSGFGSDMRYCL